jgi:hypothetical protein
MSPARLLHTLTPTAGFHAALAALGLSPQLMARGSQCFVPTPDGRMRAWPGLGLQAGVEGGTVMSPVSDGYASLGSVGSPGSGSLASHVANSLWYAGSGPLRFLGAALGSLSASSTLSFLLRSGSSYGTTPYQAGRVAPSIPAVTTRDNVGGRMTGSFALRATRINSITGGESDASDFTLPFTVTDGKAVASFDGISLDANGQDRWGLYGTMDGMQTDGPAYGLVLYPEVADSALATLYGINRAVEIEWNNALLDYSRPAPIDNDPPPACLFVAALESIVICFGVFGGTGVISSKPGLPEAFPIDNLSLLPEKPLAVYARPVKTEGDTFILVACAGSMHAVVYTGATPPYALQTIFPETGISAPHNLCFAESEIYFFTEKRGIARAQTAGAIDYAFAADVAEYTAGWTPSAVVVGYDVPTQSIVFCHGSEILPFHRQTGRWGTPQKLSALRSGGASAPLNGTITSCVTFQRKLYLGVNTGAVYALYRYSAGGGGSRAIYRSPWMRSASASETIEQLDLDISGSWNQAATVELYADGDDSAPVETFNIAAQAGGVRVRSLDSMGPNVRLAKSIRLVVTLDSDDGSEAIEAALLGGAPSGVRL